MRIDTGFGYASALSWIYFLVITVVIAYFPLQIVMVWSLINLFLMLKELHDFSGMGTVKNLLLTIFGMLILVLIFFVLYVLIDQLVQFIWSLVSEVILRV